MAVPVTVPRLGWSMEEGGFGGWLKAPGERVRPGDPLFVLESDKATETIEAIDEGLLHVPPDAPTAGDTVKVGQVLAYLTAEGESVPPATSGPVAAPVPSRDRQGAGPGSRPDGRGSEVPGDVVRAVSSPRARRVARELGVDWTGLRGSGRNGRVRERDVRAAAASSPPGELIPHTAIRRTIAARMVAGVTQAAPVTLTTKADATRLVALRNQLRAAREVPPSYTDLILKLTATALVRHPRLRAQWRDDGLFVPSAVHVAFAVDTDAGLLAPVVRDADRLTVRQIAQETRQLIALARMGMLGAERLRDAVFTVTNLGMVGVDAFTPVIHLPQCAVLGVGRVVREPAVVGDHIEPRDVLTLSLTFDHRVVDGAPAARFLDAIRQGVADPSSLAPLTGV